MELNAQNITYLLTFFVSISLAGVILIKTSLRASKIFVLLIFSISFWVLCNFLADNSNTPDQAILWARLASGGPILVGPLFYNFARNFPNEIEDRGKANHIFLISVLPSLFLLLLVPTNINISDVALKEDFGIDFTPGNLYIYISVVLLTTIFMGVGTLINKYRNSRGSDRSQLKFIGVGFFITFIFGIIFTSILPILGFSQFAVLGPASSLIMLSTIAYTLVRHRLFDIRLVIGRSIYIVTMAIVPFFTFYATSYIYVGLWGSIFNIQSYLLGFFISIIFIYLILDLNHRLTLIINKSIIDPGLILSSNKDKLLDVYGKELNISMIAEKTNKTIASIMQLKWVGIQIVKLHNDSFEIFYQKFTENVSFSKKETQTLISIFYKDNVKSGNYLYDDIRDSNLYSKEIKKLLKEKGLNLFFINSVSSDTLVLLLISEKLNENTFTEQEIKFIQEVITNLNAALDRSLLYYEVENFNATLQKKVDEATEELALRNDQLAEQLRKERDMIDILGHELRTPLGTARNALLMIDSMEQDGKVEKEKYEKFFDIAIRNIKREKDLLETILQSARLEKSRIQINLEKVAVKDVIEDTLAAFKLQAEHKGLQLITEIQAKDEFIHVDRTAIQQIVDNLVSNAVKYTYEGKVTIKVSKEGENKLRFSVIDTGEGLKPEDLKNLGKKFFRANTHLDSEGKIGGRQIVRPGGTGIGLYVIKGLLKEFGSELEVESEFGKGSKFSFVL